MATTNANNSTLDGGIHVKGVMDVRTNDRVDEARE